MPAAIARSSRSRNLMRPIPLAVLTLGAWLAGACAGRVESLSQGTDGSSGAGGSLSVAGASSNGAGAGAGQAGSPVVAGAGAPGAGAPGAGAAGAPAPAAGAGGELGVCDNIDCPDIVCGNGSEPVIPAGACCATCQCKQVCVSCTGDTHAEMQAGQCCPTCVSNKPPPLSCDAGKMQYATLRAQFVDKYSHGCSADSQCVTMTVANACENCQPVALSSSAATFFSSNTSSAAETDCAACPPIATPPCVAPPAPVCVNNVCKLPG
jgi:hypothetical protein